MGVVYEALDRELNRKVALKLLLTNDHADRTVVALEEERFIREAQLSAKLKHPNIVTVYEAGSIGGRRYLAMQLVEGTSLAAWLKKVPQASLKQSVTIIRDVALAVEQAHQQGVLHRDLKPQNVLLDKEARPYVTDFGLAKRLDLPEGKTHDGSIMGTPNYMAPEQAAGNSKEIGPATDVYALGAILYECLTGQPPFKGHSLAETLDQVRHQEAISVRQLQPRVPRDLETIAMKCLRKEKENRYPSAQELADDLGRFLEGKPILARPIRRLMLIAYLRVRKQVLRR